jgi:hypothetical protein
VLSTYRLFRKLLRKEAMMRMTMMEGVMSPRVATTAPRRAKGRPPSLMPVR